MSGKRQMTMAKRAREQAVKERRALKQEKKRAAAAARSARAADGMPPADAERELGQEGAPEPFASDTTGKEPSSRGEEKPGNDPKADDSAGSTPEDAMKRERETEESGHGTPAPFANG